MLLAPHVQSPRRRHHELKLLQGKLKQQAGGEFGGNCANLPGLWFRNAIPRHEDRPGVQRPRLEITAAALSAHHRQTDGTAGNLKLASGSLDNDYIDIDG